jgi:hypothetical protein
MRLSDARVRRRKTKLIYLNHPPSPWLTEDATAAIARLLGVQRRPREIVLHISGDFISVGMMKQCAEL